MKSLEGKKLGLLLSSGPDSSSFQHGLKLAETALQRGLAVYLYCIDDAVRGVSNHALQQLKNQGLHLFACAYTAQRKGIPLNDQAAFSGLITLNDIISDTDRFISFNT